MPLVICVLGADSQLLVGQQFVGQAIANILAVFYFGLMLLNLRREVQIMALVFVPFSALFECLFSLGFELYHYRLTVVPLYVPFGHGILFTTGLLLAESPIFSQSEEWKPYILSLYSIIFGGVILLLQDFFSGGLGLIFFWVIRRKGNRSLYLIMGLLVLYIELIGTAFGCWTWEPKIFGLIPTTNPPFGAFIFYVLGDLGVMKVSRWLNQRFDLELYFSNN